jgi:site-specific DNA-methyltransferase (adenine-specific)
LSRIETIAEGVTLYLGDCREILPTLGHVDAVVTDPPYGISYVPRKKNVFGNSRDTEASYHSDGIIAGDDKSFDPAPFLALARDAIFWGANYYADRLPTVASWIIWDKMGGNAKHHGTKTFADCELAWCSDGKPARIHQQIWSGLVRQGEEASIPRRHPNEKPIELLMMCVARFPEAATVCDPFMGSGTTGVASIRLDRKFIGIEIEPAYFDVACKRIDAAARQGNLFTEATA